MIMQRSALPVCTRWTYPGLYFLEPARMEIPRVRARCERMSRATSRRPIRGAVPARRVGWSPTPQSTPPYPYTEWPYGGATSIGVTRPSSVDSPRSSCEDRARQGDERRAYPGLWLDQWRRQHLEQQRAARRQRAGGL